MLGAVALGEGVSPWDGEVELDALAVEAEEGVGAGVSVACTPGLPVPPPGVGETVGEGGSERLPEAVPPELPLGAAGVMEVVRVEDEE